MNAADRKLTWALVLLLLASYAYFYQAGGWNENSRFDLVRAIVEDHSLSIDRFQRNTGDKALIGEHYYSDKAPGLSFLAVVPFAILRVFGSLFSSEHAFLVVASYVLCVLTVGVAGALTAGLVHRSALRLGVSSAGAILATLAYGLGSTAFPLSTMFFGHQLAGLVLFSAFFVAWKAREVPSGGKTVAVALLCAAAVLVEFPTAPAAALIALYHVGVRPSRRTWAFLAIAAVPALALAIYLGHVFGSPLTTGYGALANPAARDEMRSHGFFGITWPRPQIMAELMIGKDRGLLPYSPVLMLAIPGWLRLAGDAHKPSDTGVRALGREDRSALLLALGVVAYFVLFVSAYQWWQGGAAFGSRHLAPMLPFLALPVALVAETRPRLTAALLVPSVVFMTVVTAVQPKPAERYKSPFWDYELPTFVQGELSASNACPMIGSSLLRQHEPFIRGRSRDAFNVGMLMGGTGLRSLVPLLGLWVAAGWALRQTLVHRDRDALPHPVTTA